MSAPDWDTTLRSYRDKYTSYSVSIEELPTHELTQRGKVGGYVEPIVDDNDNLCIRVVLDRDFFWTRKFLALFHEFGHVDFYLENQDKTKLFVAKRLSKPDLTEFCTASEIRAFENQLRMVLRPDSKDMRFLAKTAMRDILSKARKPGYQQAVQVIMATDVWKECVRRSE